MPPRLPPMIAQAMKIAPGAPLTARQAASGVTLTPILCTNGQVSWQNVFRFPQPGQQSDENGEYKTLSLRLLPGLFEDDGGLGLVFKLKTVARITWGLGNNQSRAVIDVPDNSNIRIPLVCSTLTVDVATVINDSTAILAPATIALDMWENIPPTQFRRAVTGADQFQSIPTISCGVSLGEALAPPSDAMPQRQVAIARSAIADLWIPRPSGAVNVIYYESTAGTVVKQALSPPAAPFVGYNVTGPGLKNKLATNCLGIVVASGAADQVFLTFDIAF